MPLPACAVSQSAACSCHVLPLTIPSLQACLCCSLYLLAIQQGGKLREAAEPTLTALGNSRPGIQGVVPESASCKDVMAGPHTQTLCAAKE